MFMANSLLISHSTVADPEILRGGGGGGGGGGDAKCRTVIVRVSEPISQF